MIKFLFGNNQPTATVSIFINPKNFLNANSIEIKQYKFNIKNKNNISVFVCTALMPIVNPFLSNYVIYGKSVKRIFNNSLDDNHWTSENMVESSFTDTKSQINEFIFI